MVIAAVTPCDIAFFFQLCVLKRCSPLYFEPMPNLWNKLEGLLMLFFLSTIFQLNSLNITVSVYVSGPKVNRKERRCPSLFVCFCVSPCKIYGSVVKSCLVSPRIATHYCFQNEILFTKIQGTSQNSKKQIC